MMPTGDAPAVDGPSRQEKKALVLEQIRTHQWAALSQDYLGCLGLDVEVYHAAIIHGCQPAYNAYLPTPGPLINKHGERGNTALHWACLHKRWDMISMMIDRFDPDLNALNDAGVTPLQETLTQGPELDMEVVRLLITEENSDKFLEALMSTPAGAAQLTQALLEEFSDTYAPRNSALAVDARWHAQNTLTPIQQVGEQQPIEKELGVGIDR